MFGIWLAKLKRMLPWVTCLLLIGAIAFWVLAGANRGWTKTSVAKKTMDEVTGVEAVTYEQKFVPGLDFLAGCLLGAVVLAGISFLIKNKTTTKINT